MENKDYKRVYEHVLISERVLGKTLPVGTVIHHINSDRKDNRNSNLLICQNNSYHQMIHSRQMALRGSNNAHWRKCRCCHQWDDPKNLYIPKSKKYAYHKACNNEYQLKRRRRIYGIILHNKGELNPQTKIKNEDVFEIIDLRKKGLKQNEIALLYGITRTTVGNIMNGKTWGWLTHIRKGGLNDAN